MKKFLLAFLLLPMLARAQTTTTTLDSLWAIWGSSVTTQLTVSPLSLDQQTGTLVPTGQSQTVQIGFLQSSIAMTFQAPTSMSIVGIRAMASVAGTGWGMKQPLIIDIPFSFPLVVPSGFPFILTYTAPLTGAGTLTAVIGAPPSDALAPTPPSSLTATASGTTGIGLTWGASTDNVGVTAYSLERCAGAACASFAQIGSPVANSFGDAGLTAGTSYSYRVRALDGAGNSSGYSNVASAITQSPAPPSTGPSVSPLTVSLTSTPTARRGTFVLTITNPSSVAVTATYFDQVDWLVAITPSTASVKISANSSATFTLTYSTAPDVNGHTDVPGTYTGQGIVTIGTKTFTIPYTMVVK